MHWYVDVLKKYAEFNGRAHRTEYWMFTLINVLVSFAISFIAGIIAAQINLPALGLVGVLYSLAVIIPSLAVAIRRLHDTGRSGWWLLIAFVPLLGALVLLFFMVQEGKPGKNEYGPNPHGA